MSVRELQGLLDRPCLVRVGNWKVPAVIRDADSKAGRVVVLVEATGGAEGGGWIDRSLVELSTVPVRVVRSA